MSGASSIRRASRNDATVLAELRYRFRAEQHAPTEPPEAFLERCTAWMASRLDGGRWGAWIAEAEGRAIGAIWLQLIEKLPNPGPELEWHGYVTSAYVAPEWRNAGVGAALLDAALAACRAHGVDSVILWPTARSASLYRRFGFRDRPADIMELVLHPGRAATMGGPDRPPEGDQPGGERRQLPSP